MELQELLAEYETATFEYGTLDCCLFVANIIRDMGGRDLAANYRGTYSTELGAAKIILNYGGLRRMWGAHLGSYHPMWAVKVGDVVYINPEAIEPDSINEMVGIYDGEQVWYIAEDGLISADLSIAQGCWNV
jgi:hypothetical protein